MPINGVGLNEFLKAAYGAEFVVPAEQLARLLLLSLPKRMWHWRKMRLLRDGDRLLAMLAR